MVPVAPAPPRHDAAGRDERNARAEQPREQLGHVTSRALDGDEGAGVEDELSATTARDRRWFTPPSGHVAPSLDG